MTVGIWQSKIQVVGHPRVTVRHVSQGIGIAIGITQQAVAGAATMAGGRQRRNDDDRTLDWSHPTTRLVAIVGLTAKAQRWGALLQISVLRQNSRGPTTLALRVSIAHLRWLFAGVSRLRKPSSPEPCLRCLTCCFSGDGS